MMVIPENFRTRRHVRHAKSISCNYFSLKINAMSFEGLLHDIHVWV